MASGQKNLTLDDFKLDSMVLELRYQPAYALWDRSGKLWTEALSKFPELSNQEAQPNRSVFRLSRTAQLTVELERSAVFAWEVSVETFAKIATGFSTIVLDTLGVTSLTRVGMRSMYFKTCKSKQEAAEEMIGTKLLSVPPRLADWSSDEAATVFPDLAFRIEGKSVGVTARLKTDERNVKFEPPIEARFLQSVEHSKTGIVLDVDYYSRGTISIAQILFEDWIQAAHRATRRAGKELLGG